MTGECGGAAAALGREEAEDPAEFFLLGGYLVRAHHRQNARTLPSAECQPAGKYIPALRARIASRMFSGIASLCRMKIAGSEAVIFRRRASSSSGAFMRPPSSNSTSTRNRSTRSRSSSASSVPLVAYDAHRQIVDAVECFFTQSAIRQNHCGAERSHGH